MPELSQAKINAFHGIDILNAAQFTKENLETLFLVAKEYEKCLKEKKRLYDMDGKVMASLFFEPSTRTRLSFETAMYRLGGNVITVAEAADSKTSSTSKGETLRDSFIMVDAYADLIVTRSSEKGSAQIAADAAKIPVLNAGDGIGQHPSQALLDIYTIIKEKGGVDGLSVALCGDLKNGRTVHSLIDFLSLYKTKVILASPEVLAMPQEITTKMQAKGLEMEVTNNFKYACTKADVIYMTRVQRERFEDLAQYEKVKDDFIMNGSMVKDFKPGAIILHPFPRLNEIALDVDAYEGAAYFRQAANGLPVRMAMIALVTGNVKFATKI